MDLPILLAVPNVSEGRDLRAIATVGRAFVGPEGPGPSSVGVAGSRGERSPRERSGGDRPTGNRGGGASPGGVRLLDVHTDADHDRSVFTLAGRQGELADALLRGAAAAVAGIDVMGPRALADDGVERLGARGAESQRGPVGQHPHVGAVDVVPVVYLDARAKGAACAEALVVADRIGVELGVPVFLYGELASPDRGSARTRAELRRGGVAGLAERMAAAEATAGGHRPDFGPPSMHPTAGATLVAARGPLVAFNLQLASPASVADARRIAALIREGGAEGLPGVRAIGVRLGGGVAQVSMNLERPLEVPLSAVIDAVKRHAAVSSAELVGLVPRAALEGLPEDVPLPGFDPARHLIENALGS
jgi:glutamate formiminotransferase / 5-formyltetrahydrofolate cyclo-ligase